MTHGRGVRRHGTSFIPLFGQVLPCWIERLDQIDLLAAAPALDLLLSRNCVTNLAKLLIVDQSRDVVSFGKAVDKLMFVLINAPLQVAGHASVERACSTGHDIDVVLFHDAFNIIMSEVI